MLFGMFNMFSDCLTTASLYTKERNKGFYRIFLFFRLISWWVFYSFSFWVHFQINKYSDFMKWQFNDSNSIKIMNFCCRSYLFLNVLPFKYLIPTLYAKKFKLWLNVFLWCWYGFSIWNSVNILIFYSNIVDIEFETLNVSSPFYDIFTIKFIILIQMIALVTPQFLDVFYWKNRQKLNINAYCIGLFKTLWLPMCNENKKFFFFFLLVTKVNWITVL